MKVAAGLGHTLVLREDGTVWSWGDNSSGQLGDGTTVSRKIRVKLTTLPPIADIFATDSSSFALAQDGTLWAWGSNTSGRLGVGDTEYRSTPTLVSTINNVASFSASNTHCAAVLGNGSVYVWGINSYYQFGISNNTASSYVPKSTGGFVGCTQVLAGNSFTIGRKPDGTLCACGQGSYGQLGDGNTTNYPYVYTLTRINSVAQLWVSNWSTAALKQDGTLWMWGQNRVGELGLGHTNNCTSPTQVPGLQEVASFQMKNHSCFATLQNGSVFGWGYNSAGKLGMDSLETGASLLSPAPIAALEGFQSITTGEDYSVAMKADGSLWGWGDNSRGQLNNLSMSQYEVPTLLDQGAEEASQAVSAFISNPLREFTGAFSAGKEACWHLVRSRDTARYRCTLEQNGLPLRLELYDGDLQPLELEDGTVLMEEGQSYYLAVFCTPSQTYGEAFFKLRLERVEEEAQSVRPHLSAGSAHTLALREDCTVWSWGDNSQGQLGDGSAYPRYQMFQIPGLTQVVQVCAAGNSSYALKEDGTVWAWGDNGQGQLGIGSTDPVQCTPTQLSGLWDISAISCSGAHSLALRRDGAVWAWGYNNNGQLGNGSTANSGVPSPIRVASLPPIVQIFAGTNMSIALAADGNLWAWGSNTSGVFGWTQGASPVPVFSSAGKFSELVAAGALQVMARGDDGAVYVWGENTNGQLGLGYTVSQSQPILFKDWDSYRSIVMGGTHTFGVKRDGTLWAWGSNTDGKLGNPELEPGNIVSTPTQISIEGSIASVAVGQRHSAALLEDGSLWVWGSNQQNALMDRDTQQTSVPVSMDRDTSSPQQAVDIYMGKAVRHLYGVLDTRLGENWYRVKMGFTADASVAFSCSSAETGAQVLDQQLAPLIPREDGLLLLEEGQVYYIRAHCPKSDISTLSSYTLSLSAVEREQPPSVQLSAGTSHTLVLAKDGTVWAWGGNAAGQLGRNHTLQGYEIDRIAGLSGVTAICAAANSSYALLEDGTVWAWGYNAGLLGDGTTANKLTPAQVLDLPAIAQISCSSNHVLALDKEGGVWAWGYNNNGQIGDGTVRTATLPVHIDALPEIVQIFAGDGCSLAMSSYGDIWAWGSNVNSVFGCTLESSRVPVLLPSLYGYSHFLAAHYNQVFARRDDGRIDVWGYNGQGQLGVASRANQAVPVSFDALENIRSLVLCNTASFAILQDGSLWAWGYNDFGKLGDKSLEDRACVTTPLHIADLDDVLQIGAGSNHTAALCQDGRLWAWGSNALGQLADPGLTQSAVPVCLDKYGASPDEARKIRIAAPAREIHGRIGAMDCENWMRLHVWKDADYSILFQCDSPQVEFALLDEDLSPILPAENGMIHLRRDGCYYMRISCRLGRVDIVGYTISLEAAAEPPSPQFQLSAGLFHTLSLLDDGTVWSWGDNTYGQLGTGDTVQNYSRNQVPGLEDVAAVYAAENSSFALKTDGTLWSWGQNNNLQLGDGTNGVSHLPTRIAGLENVSQFSTSGAHSLALRTDGTVWAWGRNASGQLGNNGTTTIGTPQQVTGLPQIVQVLALNEASLALSIDGCIWAWGNNTAGVYGTGVATTASSSKVPAQITTARDFCRFAAGRESQVMAEKDDGTLYVWGQNGYGQLGIGNTTSPQPTPVPFSALTGIKALEMGSNNCFAILEDGSLWAWGNNAAGKLGEASIGTGAYSSVSSPVRVSTLESVMAVAPGSSHTAALLEDGSLWAWGSNAQKQFPHRTLSQNPVPLCIDQGISGADAVPVYLANPTRRVSGLLNSSWGESWLQLRTQTDADFAVSLSCTHSATRWELLDEELQPLCSGEEHSSIHLETGSVRYLKIHCPPTQRTSIFSYTILLEGVREQWTVRPQMAAGANHTLALMEDGTLWAWGDNAFGQLGDGTYTKTLDRVQALSDVVCVQAGGNTSFAVKEDGTLWAWGQGSNGKLGSGLTANRPTPAPVEGLSDVVQVSASGGHVLALTREGAVYAWGYNNSGQVGNNATQNVTAPLLVSGLEHVVQVFAGTSCSLALTDSGDLWFWGANTDGVSGGGTAGRVPTLIASHHGYSQIVAARDSQIISRRDDGLLYAWGQNTGGQLGLGTRTNQTTPQHLPGMETARLITMGSVCTFAVMEDGSLQAWGTNSMGCLGAEDINENAIVSAPMTIPSIQSVLAIAAGTSHTGVFTKEGSLWAWGSNAQNQLAHRSITQISVPLCMDQGTSSADAVPFYLGNHARRIAGVLNRRLGEMWLQLRANVDTDAAVSLLCDDPAAHWELLDADGQTIPVQQAPSDQATSIHLERRIPYYLRIRCPQEKCMSLLPYTVLLEGMEDYHNLRPQMAAGNNHTLVVLEDQTLWAWGDNAYGQLGDGTTRTKHDRVQTLSEVASVQAGVNSSYAIKADGTLWAWGHNAYGQLGNGTTASQSAPGQVAGLSNIVQVSAGEGHVLALTREGTVYAWGYNNSGQIGNNATQNVTAPLLVSGLEHVVQVFAGTSCSLALTDTGDLWFWGANTDGVSGGGTASRIPTLITFHYGYSQIVAARATQVIARRDDGLLYAWGRNTGGQLGIGTRTTQTTPQHLPGLEDARFLTMGNVCTFAVMEDGSLQAWGTNSLGCLGAEDVAVNAIIMAPIPIPSIHGVVSIAAGTSHTAALTDDDSLWAWGTNTDGQLANKHTFQSNIPLLLDQHGRSADQAADILIGATARTVEGCLNRKGDESWFHIKVLESGSYSLSMQASHPEITAILYRDSFDIAHLDEQPTIRMEQGESYYLQIRAQGSDKLSTGRFSVRFQRPESKVIRRPMIVSGAQHTLALLEDGTVWSWGQNTYGQLGDGTTVSKFQRTRVPLPSGVSCVYAGEYNSYALMEDGTLWGWGYNNAGQLGLGSYANQSTPRQIPGLTDVAQFSCRTYHCVALLGDGTLYTWGSGGSGQLSSGSTSNMATPTQRTDLPEIVQVFAGGSSTLVLTVNGEIWACGHTLLYGSASSTTYRSLTFIIGMAGFCQLAADGNTQIVARRDDGRLYTWGANTKGQLGIGTTENQYTPAPFPELENIREIKMGIDNCFARLEDGSVWAWGSNSYYKLGDTALGNNAVVTSPVKIEGLYSLMDVSSGLDFTVMIRQDRTMWAWGYNNAGQLGISGVSQAELPCALNDAPRTPSDASDILIGGRSREVSGILELQSDVHWYRIRTVKSGQFQPYLDDEASPAKLEVYSEENIPLRPNQDGLVGLIRENLYYLKVSCASLDPLCIIPYTATLEGLAADWQTIPQLSAGSSHTLALMDDGTVWSWGDNTYGQLGDGTTQSRFEQTQVPGLYGAVAVCAAGNSSFALKRDGTLWSWGQNNNAQLGMGGTATCLTPSQSPYLSDIVQLSCGGTHTLALQANGDVWVWGYNISGQMGNGSSGHSNYSVPAKVAGLPKVVQVFAGSDTSITLGVDGSFWAWGGASYYIYGVSSSNSLRPLQIADMRGTSRLLAARGYQIIAQKDDGRLYAWGANKFGQLGLGNRSDSQLPQEFTGLSHVKELVLGDTHGLAILQNGTLWAWGDNQSYKLGTPEAELDESVPIPVQVVGIDHVLAIAAGTSHSAALNEDGTLWTWGGNASLQLGLPEVSEREAPTQIDLAVYLAERNIDTYETAEIRELPPGGHALFTGLLRRQDKTDWFALRPQQKGRYALDIASSCENLSAALLNASLEEQLPVEGNLYLLEANKAYLLQVSHRATLDFSHVEYAVLLAQVEEDYIYCAHPKDYRSAELIALPVDLQTDLTGEIHSVDDVSWYLIKSQANSTCEVSLDCADPFVQVEVFDHNLRPVSYNANRLQLDHTTRHYLRVSYKPYCETTPFTIRLENEAYEAGDVPNEPLYAPCVTLPLNQASTFTGELHDRADTDWYQFRCSERATVAVALECANPDVELHLFDERLQPLELRGGSVETLAQIPFYLRVSGNAGPAFSPYTLTLHPRYGLLRIREGEPCYVAVSGTSLKALEPLTFRYDHQKLRLLDFAAQTQGAHTEPGEIPGSDLEILSHTGGSVQFVWSRQVPAGQVYDGLVTLVEFQALEDGETQVYLDRA